MAPRTFFIILLKVLGILCFKDILTTIPILITTVHSIFTVGTLNNLLWILLTNLLSLAIYAWIAYLLIFKSEYLVNKLELDKGIKESSLLISLSLPSILHISVIVTGGLILIFEIPKFCKLLYEAFVLEKYYTGPSGGADWAPAIISGVSIILGFLIIGERQRIVRFLQSLPVEKNDNPV